MAASIHARLRYCVDTGVKPVTETVGPGGRLRRRSGGQDEWREVEIHDARPRRGELSLEREGFELVDAPTQVANFWDEDELRRVYYPESEALIRRVAGARRAQIFDHTLRSGDPGHQQRDFAREPVEVVHNDYTARSGPWRLRDVLPGEYEALAASRLAIVQVWRPIRGPVEAYPLALCEAGSVATEDFVAAERRHPTRVGEIYQLSYNPAHRWSYFPKLGVDEAIVFKVYDSLDDGRARFTPHTSFELPDTPAGAIRESVEIRALALY